MSDRRMGEMIQRAYRDHVNETHPDVSDSSWAPEADTSGETETGYRARPTAVLTGFLTVVAVLWLSVLHMLSELYS